MASKGYSWNARDYAKNSQNQFQWAQELIPKLRPKETKLCWTLVVVTEKSRRNLRVACSTAKSLGIDSSREMIRLAKKSFPATAVPNLSFQVMDARNLTFHEEFDRVFSNAALHWIVDQGSVLKGVQRALKPGGRLLFQMAGKGNAKDVLRIINTLADVEPWNRFFSNVLFPYGFYDTEEYRGFLREAGLVAGRVVVFPKDMKHEGAGGLAGWVRTTWLPFTDRLPIELRAKFVQEIVNRYLEEHPPDGDGIVHVRMMRIEVEARKP